MPNFPVKPVLQSLLAEVYWRYYQQNRYVFANRTEQSSRESDFTKWDLKTILSEVAALYQLSLDEKKKEQRLPVSVLGEALVGDPGTRHFRPTLYDLLAHRALDFFLQEEADILKPQQAFGLESESLFSSNKDFVFTKIGTTDTSSASFQGLKILQDLAAFHMEGSTQAAAEDVFLKRLEFVHRKSASPANDSLYVRGLRNFVALGSSDEARSDALFQLASYYNERKSYREALIYLQEAIEKSPGTLGAGNSKQLKKKITSGSLVITLKEVDEVGKPVLVQAAYKNISQLHYSLYKINQGMISRLNAKNKLAYERSVLGASTEVKDYFKKVKPFREADVPIIDPVDYLDHRTEFVLEPLPPGQYLLLSSGGEPRDSVLENMVQFRISDLTYISRIRPDGTLEIKTLSRKSGAPNLAVLVVLKRVEYSNGYKQELEIARVKSDETGTALLKPFNNNYSVALQLSKRADTFVANAYFSGNLIKDEDILVKNSVLFFTDRQMYRPGQTIYFKGMQLRREKTGSKIVTGAEIIVFLKDRNGKQHGEHTFTTNEFGTFQGSFIIPQNALNGVFFLSTTDGRHNIQVEEYNRPSFEVELDPVRVPYKFGDSIAVKGRVLALSGYSLSGSRIAFRVTRSAARNYRYSQSDVEIASDTIYTDSSGGFEVRFKASAHSSEGGIAEARQFKVQVDATDLSGETRSTSRSINVEHRALKLNLLLPARLLAANDELIIDNNGPGKTSNSPWYIIDGKLLPEITHIRPEDIESIDIKKGPEATGIYGTKGANGVVVVTTRGSFRDSGARRKDAFIVPISILNMDQQKLSGSVKVKVFSLKVPLQTFHDRLWAKPDLPIIKKEEFQRLFPGYEYATEGLKKNWPVDQLVDEREMKVFADSLNHLDLSFLKKKPSGAYKIVLVAEDERGDTLSADYYTDLIAEPTIPSTINNWVIPVKTNVFPGEQAEFHVGTGRSAPVLVEVYHGAKLLSSRWIKTGVRQSQLKIPVDFNQKALDVQLLTIVDGQVLTSRHRISIPGKKGRP